MGSGRSSISYQLSPSGDRLSALVSIDVACGISPRKGFLRDFYVALAESDDGALLAGLTDNVRWTVVGDKPAVGSDAVVELLARRVERTTTV